MRKPIMRKGLMVGFVQTHVPEGWGTPEFDAKFPPVIGESYLQRVVREYPEGTEVYMNGVPVDPAKRKRYYSTKTLVGCDPDINRRHIHDSREHSTVVTMNQEMGIWTSEHDRICNLILKTLNEDAG